MHTQPTATLIARGRELNRIIADSKTELSEIEEILRSRALAVPHEPLTQANREGRRAILRDADQELAVVFESDLLKASFTASTPLANALQNTLMREDFDALFSTKTTHERKIKDGHKFRQECSSLLPSDLAALIIDTLKDRDKNGIAKSKSVFNW